MKIEDEELLSAFNATFGKSVRDVEVVRRLLGSPHVRAWYAEYRREKAAEKTLPPQWKEVGLTKDQWLRAQSNVSAIRKHRAHAAERIAEIAQEFDKKLESIRKEAELKVSPLEDTLTRIVLSNYETLPLDYQVVVESAPADKRDEELDRQLQRWRRWALGELSDGRNPFRV